MDYGDDGMTENKRFTVEKMEIVSNHLSTRFYIKDNFDDEYYDVQHIVSVDFEVQYESWADKICEEWNTLNDKNEQLKKENKELKEINQDNQDYISSLEEEKINLQIKLQKIRDYAMEDGEVKQGVIEKVIFE